ncbi:MAG: hypothetical protein I3273_02910 [Candidatus Moeniiplasma glomeromycotorum]|nr:hypothetical protein [Candidatus Moeniiplasma glomeromycotorum]MCE8162397.1 hypothetical protein [Candidatus Moeniiplasma glomeromycotorum]MCE8163183.1 hypothetical protein [Candidatus Moeniiplasma glomeromycotorum]MCE8166323.1 hypothetical protein [Candidatus Moeniiplasma glomeromycotorum]MCE8166805.1 hypothetical protein [Candidatus Moeniiplasma glomeromycotorum]
MRIIQNSPCKKCSPSEANAVKDFDKPLQNKKHCFSHGFCEFEFTRTTTFLGFR